MMRLIFKMNVKNTVKMVRESSQRYLYLYSDNVWLNIFKLDLSRKISFGQQEYSIETNLHMLIFTRFILEVSIIQVDDYILSLLKNKKYLEQIAFHKGFNFP